MQPKDTYPPRDPNFAAGYAAGQREAASQYAQAPPQYVYVPQPYPNGNVSKSPIDASRLQFSVATAFAIMITFGGSIWWGASQFAKVTNGMETMVAALNRSVADNADTKDRIKRLEIIVMDRTSELFTKSDYEMFCARAETQNHKIGWLCPLMRSSAFRSEQQPKDNYPKISDEAWETTETKAKRAGG